jgi:DNA-binding response OmpR family regulator
MLDTKILIIDGDHSLSEHLKSHFEAEGYGVKIASDGSEGMNYFKIYEPDIVLLDIVLQKKDGLQVCKEIRENSSKPIIMISTKGEVIDKVLGLEFGADDFVVKPFKRAVLLERVKRLLSDYKDRNSICYVCDDLTLSQSECRVYIKGEPIKMTSKEYQLLLLLMKNPRRALSREAILDKIWGFEYDGNDRTIDTHIKMLRHSLGDYGERIRTIRGMGYSFDGEVREK